MAAPAGPAPASAWVAVLARYREPDARRSLRELVVTAAPLAALWSAALLLVAQGWWWGMLLCVPAALFLVRLFMILHDCSHGSFFRARAANDWTGRVIGVLTLTPYDCWRRLHARHHARSGNLDEPPVGGIETLAVDDYFRLPPLQRLRYRLLRHPLVLFGLGPAWLFLLQQRVPLGLMREGWRPWASAMGANLAIAAVAVAGVALFGAGPFLAVWLTVMILAGTIGVWLFYVQHQFDGTHWSRRSAWDLHEAALHGSSWYDLPQPLRWLTANIGVHHVHHLNSRIPFYRLPEALDDHPQLKACGRVTLLDSFRTVRLALWDEARGRLVSFREAQAMRAQAA